MEYIGIGVLIAIGLYFAPFIIAFFVMGFVLVLSGIIWVLQAVSGNLK